MLAARPELAHLDIAKWTAFIRRRARFASGPIRPGSRQRGILHARRLGLQVRLAPQLPGLGADRSPHGRGFGLRGTTRLRPATRALPHRGGELVGSFAFSRPPWLASGWASLGRK